MTIVKKILTGAMALACLSSATAFTGKVVSVLDGDTVIVLDAEKHQHRIRLIGVDAPEKAMDFGSRSKELMSDLIFGKVVDVPDNKTDNHERTLSRIFYNGQDVGLAMVKAGMAWHYVKYEREQSIQDRVTYRAAEKSARDSKLGLWSLPNPQPPEDFRKKGVSTPSPVAFKVASSECPCSSQNICTGPKGGRFCLKEDGAKSYLKH